MPQSRRVSNIAVPDDQKAPRKRILVVDDSRLQRRIIAGSLKRRGYDVAEAGSGTEALEMCRAELPDLILSDWMMPEMNGLEFCRAVRALPVEGYAYFILLTSKNGKGEVAAGLDAGADDFLIKPVDSDELRARITAGERIIDMRRELARSNRMISDTLAELQRVYDSLDKDLLEAKKLQQSLLPERHRSFDGGSLSLLLRSSGHVGGDLVGFFEAGEGQLGLYAIDVSGHGISSALMTARLAGYLSATAPEHNVALSAQTDGTYAPFSPSEVVETLNDLILNEVETEHYFTLLLALVDLTSGRVKIAQAGHPHPLIHRADGQIEQFGTGGFPVGLLTGIPFEQFEITLGPGDRLLILSDGVTECPDPAGALLGEEGLAEIMTDLRAMSDSAVLSALLWRLSEHAGTADFPDDVSAILFEYQPPQ